MLRGIWRSMGAIRLAVLVVLVMVAVGSSLLSAARNPAGADDEWWSGWLQNFSTEMMGAIVTFLLFELIVGSVQQREAKREREIEHGTRLLREIRSGDKERIKSAIEEARDYGFLTMPGGLFSGVYLESVDLSGEDLSFADFSGAILRECNFQDTYLMGANFQDAEITGSLFQDASLPHSDLQWANFYHSKLQGTDFGEANLTNAVFTGAEFDSRTTLPDESLWSTEIRFEELTQKFGCFFPATSEELVLWRRERSLRKGRNKRQRRM